MPRLPKQLLTWNRGSRAHPVTRSDASDNNASNGNQGLDETLARLHEICKGSRSHPFVRPFGNMLSIVEQSVSGRAVPFPVGPALAGAVQFLEPSLDSLARLEFAINSHSSTVTRQFLLEVEGALTVLADVEDRVGLKTAIKAMLEQWHEFGERFKQRCQEVWDLYVYFVFLDIKGDKPLIDQAVNQFRELLDCTPEALTNVLANSRGSAEIVLRGLANREFQPALEARHKLYLEDWYSGWSSQLRSSGISLGADVADSFWVSCFAHNYIVLWSDFLQAFQAFFVHGPCPTDVVNRLHLLLDPTGGTHISLAAWQKLVEQHGSVDAVLDVVLRKIFVDMPSAVYRSEDLPFREESAPTSSSSGSGQSACWSTKHRADHASGDRKAGKSRKDKPQHFTESSESVLVAGAAGAKAAANNASPSTGPTPQDRLQRMHNSAKSCHQQMSWEEYNMQEQQKRLPWWIAPGEKLSPQDERLMEDLRVSAIRVVRSSIVLTNRMLHLRMLTGDLANGLPILKLGTDSSESAPTLVVMPNAGRNHGFATFGRGSSRSASVPDFKMSEPIASRVHFGINYDQQRQQYCISDAGSKWGTFVNISSREVLNCGDWIRAGEAEFVIRYCGGGCSCKRNHANRRVQHLYFARQRSGVHRNHFSESSSVSAESEHEMDPEFEDRAMELNGELSLLLSNRRRCGWTSASDRLCHAAAANGAECCGTALPEGCGVDADGQLPPTAVPIAPLELDFISGPRMGEKVVLWDRVSTLGRGEKNTIQVSDTSIVNISRMHCVFEYIGNRWHIRDNQSTNGTMRRLSCILQPSKPMPLAGGECILAGTHEFVVKEAEANLGCLCLPSVGADALQNMRRQV